MNGLAPYVRILGRGPNRSRNLSREEARDAMRAVLEGDAAPEAVGAMLMLMRARGETAAELAGFAEAAAADLAPWRALDVAVDWPTYAAGLTRGAPLFLLAAELLAAEGVAVLLHGPPATLSRADTRHCLDALQIPIVETPAEAARALARRHIAYAPIEVMAPELHRLLRLREVLGLRSCVNTLLRLLDPAGAALSVQGVFHPPYKALQRDASALLGRKRLIVLKGGGGEFERAPRKTCHLLGLRDGAPFALTIPPLVERHETTSPPAPQRSAGPERADDPDPTLSALKQLRATRAGSPQDGEAAQIVVATAALALFGLGRCAHLDAAHHRAARAWRRRAPREGERAA